MASEEPVTSPDQHKPTPIALIRLGGIAVIVSLLLMLFGNNEVSTGAPWLIGIAALIALMLIIDGVQRRNGLKD